MYPSGGSPSTCFNPRPPPTRRATLARRLPREAQRVSTHALRRRGERRRSGIPGARRRTCFNPRPPPTRRATSYVAPPCCSRRCVSTHALLIWGGRPAIATRWSRAASFNPRPPPTRRATHEVGDAGEDGDEVSTHALRRRGERPTGTCRPHGDRRGFNPRPPPTRRATSGSPRRTTVGERFQPTPSADAESDRSPSASTWWTMPRFNPRPPPTRRATPGAAHGRRDPGDVSTHALRRRGERRCQRRGLRRWRLDVSTHALRRRGERQAPTVDGAAPLRCFNPRPPPTRRATPRTAGPRDCAAVMFQPTPSADAESDASHDELRGTDKPFQPTPTADADSDSPRATKRASMRSFQPTPSADAESDSLGRGEAVILERCFNPRPPPTRRATVYCATSQAVALVSTHALRRRGERRCASLTLSRSFNPRPLIWGGRSSFAYMNCPAVGLFQPTPSADAEGDRRGRRDVMRVGDGFQPTPSADAESDPRVLGSASLAYVFQPTPSADAESDARRSAIASARPSSFNPRPPPTRRATSNSSATRPRRHRVSTHALRRRGERL